jgi:hypothetical protein
LSQQSFTAGSSVILLNYTCGLSVPEFPGVYQLKRSIRSGGFLPTPVVLMKAFDHMIRLTNINVILNKTADCVDEKNKRKVSKNQFEKRQKKIEPEAE